MIKRSAFPLLLLGAIAALYGQFLWNPIVFDDLPFFILGETGSQLVDSYHYAPLELRSLPYATLAWSKAAFGLDMLHFRIENLLLHAAVSIVLFLFLEKLFGALQKGQAKTSLNPAVMAFCAALLFAIHPVSVYAVGYLVQRTIVMSTLFSLLAMFAYLHGSLKGNAVWMWASVLFYFLAVTSKEHAVMLPAALLALTILLHEDWRSEIKKNKVVLFALLLVAVFVIAAKKGILGSAYEIYAPEMLDAEASINYPLSVLTQSWLFFKYLALWLFPNPAWMSVDMREPFAQSLFSVYALSFIAFLAWGICGCLLLFKRGRLGMLGFAMLFPWLLFMTELSAIRIQENFVLYRSYLWAVGSCVVLPLLLERFDKRMAGIVVGAIVLAMFPISMERLASFSHPLVLWDDAEKLVKGKPELPGAYRIYYNRGTELLKVDEYEAAIRDLKLSAELHPDWPYAYNNLGAAYASKMDWERAVVAFGDAIEVAQRKHMGVNVKPYWGRALVYENMGKFDLAQRDYEVTCRVAKMGCEKLRNAD